MLWLREQVSFVFENDLTEGSIATIAVETPNGRIMIMGEPREEGDKLVVGGVHIHGVGIFPNDVTASNPRILADAILETMDYDEIIVEGAVRTSGANPGRRPRPLRFARRRRDPSQSSMG